MRKWLLFLTCIWTINVVAQHTRTFRTWAKNDTCIFIDVNDGRYQVVAYSQDIIEVHFFPGGKGSNSASHAVATQPLRSPFKVKENPKVLELRTESMRMVIQKSPFHIQFFRGEEWLLTEGIGYTRKENFHSLTFDISSDEALYGGGARALGMNRRGHRLSLYNKAHYGYEERSELLNYTMPIAISSKKYLLHFDNAPIGSLDLDSKGENKLTYETIGGRMCYQVVCGDSWSALLENYTILTGRQPLPPRWVLGNFASRFGYHSEAETRKVVTKFTSDSIPLDAVVLDLYWFGKDIQGTLGNLAFYRDSFPTGEKMIQDFAKDGVQTVLITEPFILTTSKRWKEAIEADILCKDSLGKPFTYDFYFGNTGLIDLYSDAGKRWFWKIYQDLRGIGVKGFWGDLGEPEVHPTALQHATGSADEVHNIYGHDWARLITEGYREHYPDERPFILMRSGYSGTQRHGIIPWSGDVNRTWGGLKSQMEISLQMGLQGIAYMHSDLGGFAGANDDPELYLRWLQYGVFQPVFRPHAQEQVASEPIFKDSITKQLAKQAIQLRYDLLPYNYTLAFENSRTGHPMMRPLFYAYDDDRLLSTSSTYLWGSCFLVTPVTDSAAKMVEVTIPGKSTWYDFYSDKRIENHTSDVRIVSVTTQREYIPVWVKAGSFIPMCRGLQRTKAYDKNRTELHFYADPDVTRSTGELYEDDGEFSRSVQEGAYRFYRFQYEKKKEKHCITIETKIKSEPSDSDTKTFHFLMHNLHGAPKVVELNGQKVDFRYDASKKLLEINVLMNEPKVVVRIY
jgi:oligosaccharide 4-alpha-D-glucosyltransferase